MTNGPYRREPLAGDSDRFDSDRFSAARPDTDRTDTDRYDTAELDLGTQRLPAQQPARHEVEEDRRALGRSDTVVMPQVTGPVPAEHPSSADRWPSDAAPTMVSPAVAAPGPGAYSPAGPPTPAGAPFAGAQYAGAPNPGSPNPGSPYPGSSYPGAPSAASVVATVLAESPRGGRPGARVAAVLLVLLLLAAYVAVTLMVVGGNSAASSALAALPGWITPGVALALLTGVLLVASLLTLGLSGLGAGLGGVLLALTSGALLLFLRGGDAVGEALRLSAFGMLGTSVLLIAAGIGAHFARRDGFRRAQRATERALGIR